LTASVQIRFEVQELISRYADAINHNDWQAYRDCWVEDGVFVQVDSLQDTPGNLEQPLTDRPANLRVEGADNITELVTGYGKFAWAFQIPTAVLPTLESADTARIRHVLQIHTSDMYTIGFCYDKAVLEADGVWRLSHREYRPSYFERPSHAGVVTRHLPDEDYLKRPLN